MKKAVKTAGIAALSAVLACGALGAFAGCGGGGGAKPLGDKDTLTVSIFCNDSDAATNEKICNDWAAAYNKKNGTNVKVKLTTETNKQTYFDTLKEEFGSGTTADVIYLSPKFVKSYAENGNVLDLTGYLGEEDFALLDDVWQNGISYYGYIKGQQLTYKMGQPLTRSGNKFVTAASGEEVGLYGLPKDYSNFSTGYNRKFFSDTLKTAYTTTKPNCGQKVKSPTGEGTSEYTSKIGSYDHSSEDDECIVYAANAPDGSYKQGDVANIINIGIPTTYYPYNFFRYANFRQALDNGDPVAIMSYNFGGYTVTIPGFPNDKVKITEDDFKKVYTDDFNGIDVPYDKTMGHITYTYAEYGALLWACTYYLNTFAWDEGNDGYGGMTSVEKQTDGSTKTKHLTVYGGEQYEGIAGATGSVLYLLPWLAANDADLINDVSALTSQAGRANGVDLSKFTDETKWKDAAGKATYTKKKTTLANTSVDKEIQYGHDSENFIETYAAFLAIGSDWNANPSGDTPDTDRANNGWAYFRTGRSLCYGAGSWDAATRNDYNQSILDFGQMPTPVSEKYALYSSVKDANYQRQDYANDPAPTAAGSADEAKQLTNTDAARAKVYSQEDILKNQIRRQDKWAARMDTVAYAVAGKVADYTGDHAWKAQAAAALVAQLTINKDSQVELLYAGAQLPNFVSQCEQFVNYQDAQYRETGAFKDMLTPEGFADTASATEGKEIWTEYYKIAEAMETEAQKNSGQTVKEFLSGKTVKGEPVKYDESYADTRFSQFTGNGNARLAFAMKILRMVTYRADDRDINIRMQCGLNGVRDSSMYTYQDTWMSSIDARNDTGHMIAYSVKPQMEQNVKQNLLLENNAGFTSKYIQMLPAKTTTDDGKAWSYYTPAVWCFTKAPFAQQLLEDAISDELKTMVGR